VDMSENRAAPDALVAVAGNEEVRDSFGSKEQMRQNIMPLIERGERLESLLEGSDELAMASRSFGAKKKGGGGFLSGLGNAVSGFGSAVSGLFSKSEGDGGRDVSSSSSRSSSSSSSSNSSKSKAYANNDDEEEDEGGEDLFAAKSGIKRERGTQQEQQQREAELEEMAAGLDQLRSIALSIGAEVESPNSKLKEISSRTDKGVVCYVVYFIF
jgi:hypothetical protein